MQMSENASDSFDFISACVWPYVSVSARKSFEFTMLLVTNCVLGIQMYSNTVAHFVSILPEATNWNSIFESNACVGVYMYKSSRLEDTDNQMLLPIRLVRGRLHYMYNWLKKNTVQLGVAILGALVCVHLSDNFWRLEACMLNVNRTMQATCCRVLNNAPHNALSVLVYRSCHVLLWPYAHARALWLSSVYRPLEYWGIITSQAHKYAVV